MTAATLVSTDNFAPRERAPVWREWVWKHFGGLESDLYGDTDFDGEMVSAQAGDVVLTRLEANRHRVVRTPDMVRASDAGYLKIVAPLQGRAGVEQMGRRA
ncbi:MAG: DNA-binding protein, partial [Polaromonas sp.]|nr:DNA-binding protein [Polaromonas sp.]